MIRTVLLSWGRLLAAVALAGGLTGCAAPSTPHPGGASTARPTAFPAPSTAVPTVAASPTDDTLTLTWWTPEFFSPNAPQPAGPLLAQQVAEFEQAAGGIVRVSPVLKARYGKGGLLDFLATAQGVAPGILPDLVALDVAELESAVAAASADPQDAILGPGLQYGANPWDFISLALALVLGTAGLPHVLMRRPAV